MNEYIENIIDHYKNPRFFERKEVFEKIIKSSNESCGDKIEIYKVSESNNIKYYFHGEGCALTIASASILCEMLNTTQIDIKNWNLDNFINYLGIDVTVSRKKCINLPFSCIKELIKN